MGGREREKERRHGTGSRRGDWMERDGARIVNHGAREKERTKSDRVERRRRSCEGCGERLRQSERRGREKGKESHVGFL